MTRDYRAELAAKGKRRVSWRLPIELVELVEQEAEDSVVSPSKLVELILTRVLITGDVSRETSRPPP